MSYIYNASWKTNMQFLPFSDVNPVADDTIGMSFMGVCFSEKGATSQFRSVYLIIVRFLPAIDVSAWLSSSHLPWKGSPTIFLMVSFVDDLFLSKVWISEVFRPLFILCVLLWVYGLVQMLNLNTIHSRHYATQLIFQFFLVCAFSARPPKAFPSCTLPPNELMVDPPDDPLVTMDEMEASILDFLVFSSDIVASSADFSRFFLFRCFQSGRPLCRVVELLLLQLSASWALRISSQWGLTKSLNHFSQGMCHEISTRCCHKCPDLKILPIIFPGLTLQMPFVRYQRVWKAPYSQYLVVPPYNCGVGD